MNCKKATSRSTDGANKDRSLLVACRAMGTDPAHEEVDALLGQGGRPRALHCLCLVLGQVAAGVGELAVSQLHNVMPRPLPVEVDSLAGKDTGRSFLTSYNPVNFKACSHGKESGGKKSSLHCPEWSLVLSNSCGCPH